MAFVDYEGSIEGGEPLELCRVRIGTRAYNYAFPISEPTITVGDTTYDKIEMTRTEVLSGETVNGIELQFPQDCELGELFVNAIPGQKAFIEVRKIHRPDIGTDAHVVVWEGYVSSVVYNGVSTFRMNCKPLTGTITGSGPRRQFANLCSHTLGDAYCTIDLGPGSVYKTDGDVSEVDGDWITIDGISVISVDPEFFKGGYVKFESPGGDDYRTVLEQDGDRLRLMLPFFDNVMGETLTAVAGCPHTLDACQAKFGNNEANFGGFPYVPLRNAFTSKLKGEE